jgi:hypothetical protein
MLVILDAESVANLCISRSPRKNYSDCLLADFAEADFWPGATPY